MTATKKATGGFTAEEKAAMKARAKEEKALATRAEGEQAVRDALAGMDDFDRDLGERLIDVHGQHESRALLDPERQRDLLDAFGGISAKREAYRTRRDAHAALLSRRAGLLRESQGRERERALLWKELACLLLVAALLVARQLWLV